jgi:hypothetical protein
MNEIIITNAKITPAQLKSQCKRYFTDMVKLVIDVAKEVVAIGGELHADAETLLLEHGSSQKDLWGANFYPWNPPEERIAFTALINIRPHQDNPSLEILDPILKGTVKAIIENLVLSPNENLV